MSSREKPGTAGKQPKSGKRRQAWTERALARAGRACPDRMLRLNLQTGVLELAPRAEADEAAEPGENVFEAEAERLRKAKAASQ